MRLHVVKYVEQLEENFEGELCFYYGRIIIIIENLTFQRTKCVCRKVQLVWQIIDFQKYEAYWWMEGERRIENPELRWQSEVEGEIKKMNTNKWRTKATNRKERKNQSLHLGAPLHSNRRPKIASGLPFLSYLYN